MKGFQGIIQTRYDYNRADDLKSWKGRYLHWLNHQLQNSKGDQPPPSTESKAIDPYSSINIKNLEISDNPVFHDSFNNHDDPNRTLFKIVTVGSVAVGKSMISI